MKNSIKCFLFVIFCLLALLIGSGLIGYLFYIIGVTFDLPIIITSTLSFLFAFIYGALISFLMINKILF